MKYKLMGSPVFTCNLPGGAILPSSPRQYATACVGKGNVIWYTVDIFGCHWKMFWHMQTVRGGNETLDLTSLSETYLAFYLEFCVVYLQLKSVTSLYQFTFQRR